MDDTTRARFESRARIIKAMAHPTRLFMVDELGRGERCVADMQQLVQADMSTVSKHLTVLKQSGIVKDDKRGSQVFYSLRCPCVLDFFDCVESVMQTSLQDRLEVLDSG